MAFKQSVIFTVLPFGVVEKTDGTYLNFSVLVSPRLENTSSTAPPTTLGNYPDWATGRTWPQTIDALKTHFSLRLKATGLDAAYPATIIGKHQPDSARFEKIFPADTEVIPYKYQGFEHRKIRSAPVAAAVDVIQTLYGRFGLTSPSAFPTYGELAPVGSFGALGFEQEADRRSSGGGNTMSGLERKAKLLAALEGEFKNGRRAIPPPDQLKTLAKSLNISGALVSMVFLQHQRFLQRDLPKQHVTQRPPTPDWDFHQMVAGLSSMPTLLRVLGLVLDMQVGPVASSDLGHGHVTAALELKNPPFTLSTKPVLPTTYSVLTKGEFVPAAKPGTTSDHTGRMLKLGDAKLFELIRVDHDSAVVKSMQFANTVTRSRKAGSKPLTLSTPSRYALPALKTGGFAIARSGRAVQMAAVLARQTAALEGGGTAPALYLDDVMRGYRFDVLDVADGVWRSLMWRQGSITIDGAAELKDVLEEDTVVPAPTTASRADHAGDLYLQETFTRWDGWSLAVPRIGEPFRGAGPTNAKSGSSGFNVTTDWHVPGQANATKLPRLRFGRSYRMRARASDLAGNALPVDSAPATSEVITPAMRHLRFEPVAAPRALLVDAPLPGASEEIVVVRSESATVDDASDLDNSETVRLLVPAPTSVFMAEQHGVLDLAGTSGRPMNDTAAAYGQLVTRDGRSVEDDRTNPGAPVSTTNPALYPKFLPIRYLPDVLGRTALVRGLPVNSDKQTVASLPFDTRGAGWPNLQAARVRLSRGPVNWSTRSVTDPSTAANVTTELDLTLDKGDMFTALVNCHIDQSAVSIMAIWEWIEQYAIAVGKDPAAVLKQIVNGEHWMITPWRLVTFIHAVRTPLKNPELFLIPAKTEIGQTFAAFGGTSNFDAGTVLMSRKSTARIDVDATWSMPIDTGSNADPVTPQNFAGHAFSLELTRNGQGFLPGPRSSVVSSPDAANFDLVHQFGDTKFRAVTYQATATSFYVEYFREQLTLSSGAHAVSDLQANPATPGVAFEESTVRMQLTWTTPGQNGADQAHARTLVRAPDGTDPKTGDPNLGDYVVVADPTNGPDGTVQILTKAVIDVSGLDQPAIVFSYVGPTIHTFSDPGADHTTALTVPNSKRPDAPDVLYVIPIYSRVATGTQVTRKGGALRVYLKRPWWSSGAGERLGVVCWRKSAHSSAVLPPNDVAPYVTLWGYDPMFKTHRSLPGQPTPECFPLHTATGSAMPIDETSERVDVAGHNVGFDSTRGLWYCDIRVAATSGKELTAYMPFVRFAFARFQTHSITGAHLSKVVVADYAQLAPNRSVTMTGTGSTRTVTVAGRAPVRTDAADEPSKMLVTIEQRDTRIADDDLAWTPTSANAVELRASVSDSDFVTWTGSIKIPSSTKPLRLAFEEFERIAGNNGKGRLIFTETLPLTTVVGG